MQQNAIIKRFVLFAIIAFCCPTILQAQNDWLAAKSENFSLAGEISEKQAREILRNLEDFRARTQNAFPRIPFKTPFPTSIVILKNPDFQTPNDNFAAGEDSNVALLNLSRPLAPQLENVRRQYARFLLENNVGRRAVPAWLLAALAERFATEEKPREFDLDKNRLVPLENLLETSHYDAAIQDAEKKAIFAAEAVSFLNFLLTEKGDDDFAKIEKLFAANEANYGTSRSLASVFGVDAKNAEQDFENYLRKNKTRKARSTFAPAEIAVETKNSSESDGLALVAEYFYCLKRPKEAENYARQSLSLDAANARALSLSALIKAEAFYRDEAENLAQKAIQAEPANYLHYYRRAKALSRQGMTEYGFVSGYPARLSEAMRENLFKAIKLNPEFAPSYALIAFVAAVRAENAAEGLELIEKALAFAPRSEKYPLVRAELNLRTEKFVQARRDALETMRSASGEAIKLYAQNVLQRIDSTEYQLERIRSQKNVYVNDDIVSEKPLTDEQIRLLREKAIADQIRASLRRPSRTENRIIGNLLRIECQANKVNFFLKTESGEMNLQAKSLDGVALVSYVEEMSNVKLNCGDFTKENAVSAIYEKESKRLISLEFAPKGFKLKD